ncbi:hypothetical protein BCR44DRAFT_115872 [Catenaria anguillulae PL171]|uniref:Uncharacterized protein n=1 Tax=Catenaria anguillulae PL171 TaxID=765915 RepID=A0A1Y2H6D0_9FUNG|nr:hypothetical protein BCR44DRAFT_115872 [Catenaria anguillulae PL171]
MATVDGPIHTAVNTATQGFRLQPASSVAARAAASHLLLSRWGLEHMLNDATHARPDFNDAIRAQTKDKVAEANEALMASAHMLTFTPVEKTFLNQPLGSVAEGHAEAMAAMVELEGRWESFGVLLWSLGLIPSAPAHTHRFEMPQLLGATGIVPAKKESIERFLSQAHTLRPEPQLVAELNKAEAWYWRARAQVLLSLKQAIDDPSCDTKDNLTKLPKALKDMAKKIDVSILYATSRGLQDGLIDEAVGDDFGIPDAAQAGQGKPGWKRYADGSETEWATMRLIAENRLAAFGWLMAGRDWDVNRDDISFVNHMSSLWQPAADEQ